MRGCILVFLLLCSPAFAQTVVTTPLALNGLKAVRQVGDAVFVDEKSVPKLEPVLLVELTTMARTKTSVTVWDADDRVVPMKLISDPELSDKDKVPKDKPLYFAYQVTQSGVFRVRSVCVDFDVKVYEEFEDTFTVGPPPPPPEPPKPPVPPVPPDLFNNIGQRVAGWAAGLPSNAAMLTAYAKAAERLRTDPSQTIDSASALLSTDLKAIQGVEAYANVTTQINADLKSRWPLSRGELADYFAAVSLGFGGGK
jgi:hypothetical protein